MRDSPLMPTSARRIETPASSGAPLAAPPLGLSSAAAMPRSTASTSPRSAAHQAAASASAGWPAIWASVNSSSQRSAESRRPRPWSSRTPASTSPAARAVSPAARRWRIACSGSLFASYQALARLFSSTSSAGSRRWRSARRMSASRRWQRYHFCRRSSGTINTLARSRSRRTPPDPCPSTTASQSGPESWSSTEVSVRNRMRSGGSCPSSSS